MSLPKLIRVQQVFDKTRLEDAAEAVATGLRRMGIEKKIRPGARIAITAGSRGIQNLVKMTRAAVDTVKALGGRPFIVPAMGSHGGATDDGQKSLLADLGISEATMGCPVLSSVAVEEIGHTPAGVPVYLDKNALHADGIIAINRVKLHTIFRGDVESGLCKILAVGLGKHKGAQQIHRIGVAPILVETARVILAKAPVLAGVAVLENSRDETMEIHVVPPEQFEATDAALLKRAWQVFPRVPFDPLDVAHRGRDGKEYQRNRHGHQRHRDRWARGRQDDDGDAGGLDRGRAGPHTGDPRQRQRHWPGGPYHPAPGGFHRLQIHLYQRHHDAPVGRGPAAADHGHRREAIELAVGDTPADELRVVRIKNTLHLEELEISEALLPEARKIGLTILGEARELEFDAAGRIRPF